MPTKKVIQLGVAVGLGVGVLMAGEWQQLSSRGLTQNPLLRSYIHQLNQARLDKEARKGQLFPTLSAQLYAGRSKYQYNYPETVIKYNQFTRGYSVSLSFPLWNWEIFDQIKEGEKRERYYQLQLAQFKQQLLEKIGESYLGVVALRGEIGLLEEEVALLRQLMEGAKLKFRAHLIGEVEYRQSVAKYWEKRGELEQLRGQLQTQLAQLRYWTGGRVKLPREGFRVGALLSLPIPTTPNWRNAPALQIAKINVEVAKAQWEQQKDRLLPTLNFRGSYSDTKTTDSITKRKDYEGAIYLNIPLYNRQDLKGAESAREGYLSYRARYLDKKRELEAQFRGSVEQLQGLKEQLRALEESVAAGRLNLEKAQQGYKNRLISIFDLYSAIEGYYSSRRQLLESQQQLLKGYLQLLQLQGELSLDKIGKLETLYLTKVEGDN